MEKLATMFTPPAGRKPNGSRSPRARFSGHVTAVGNNHPITCLTRRLIDAIVAASAISRMHCNFSASSTSRGNKKPPPHLRGQARPRILPPYWFRKPLAQATVSNGGVHGGGYDGIATGGKFTADCTFWC
jgi:hypothetical protein